MRPAWITTLAIVAACRFHGADYTPDGGANHADAPGASDAGADGAGTVDAAADASPPVTVTFGEVPGATYANVTTDAWIESANAGQNHGADTIIWVDNTPVNNGLLEFDLTAIPAGATVTDAQLVVTTTLDLLETGTVQVYPALEGWTEGGSSWNNRMSGTGWADAGASPPGSRSTFMIGELTPNAALTAYTVPLAIGTVQTWIDTPSTNLGMVLISTSTDGHGCSFTSRDEAVNVSARPWLQITYSMP